MADYKREPALMLFASEIAKTTVELERSQDDKFATAYAVSPTGAKINRVFHVGTLTEIEEGENDFVRGRIVDPTGAVHIRAGIYQQEIAAAMKQLANKLPMFVAVTGKLNIYKPEDGQVYVSIRPESITPVTETEREIWMAETTRQTLGRIKTLVISPEKLPLEIRRVIDDCYAPDLNGLKNIVRMAAGLNTAASPDSTPEGAGKEETGKPETDAGKAQPDSVPPDSSSKPKATEKKEKTPPEKVHEEVPASDSKTATGINENKINAACKLLTDLCSSSENGTVGGNEFIDKMIKAKIASADKGMAVIKALFDTGMAYEPQMGRLKAVV